MILKITYCISLGTEARSATTHVIRTISRRSRPFRPQCISTSLSPRHPVGPLGRLLLQERASVCRLTWIGPETAIKWREASPVLYQQTGRSIPAHSDDPRRAYRSQQSPWKDRSQKPVDWSYAGTAASEHRGRRSREQERPGRMVASGRWRKLSAAASRRGWLNRQRDRHGTEANGTFQQLGLKMVKGSLPSLPEPDVWTGTAEADVMGALRRKRAEIHRGSRRRRIGPLTEAGYTSAMASSEPEPTRPLQSGGVHIHPHTPRVCRRLIWVSYAAMSSVFRAA